MKKIAVIAQKGGVGKSTLAENLAVAAVQDGKAVLLVDLDPQATACKWADRRAAEQPLVIDAQPARLQNAFSRFEDSFDFAIIDTGARLEESAKYAAELSDLVLVPCKPSITDLESIENTFGLIIGRAKRTPIIILNQVPPQEHRRVETVAALSQHQTTICPYAVGQRVAFEYAARVGQSVIEYEPDGKAAEEIRSVYKYTMLQFNETTEGETAHVQAKTA